MDEEKSKSFAMEVKEEIASHDFPLEAARALLSGFAKTSGSLRLEAGEELLDLSSETLEVAKLLHRAAKQRYGREPRFSYSRYSGKSKRVRYHVLVPDAWKVLDDLKVDLFSGKIDPSIVKDGELSACYLSGCFLASGSVNDPSSSNYHLEIVSSSQSYAKWLSHLINKILDHHFTSKVAARRKQWIVYMKRSDQISEFLVLIGATDACLKFESVRIDRDEANIDNRLINLDTANMSKTLGTSQKQIRRINYLLEKDGWSAFPSPKMAALMQLRLDHPEASMGELAELLSEELSATVTKSNINHLFRALEEKFFEEGGSDE